MKDMDIYRYLRSGWQAVSATLKYSIKLAGLLPVMCFTLIFGANAIAQTLTLTEVVQLLAGDGMLDDQFGVSVALDGDTVLIGAKLADNNAADTGVAYVFTRDGATWTFQDKLFAGDGAAGDDFGESVALIGNTAVIGARQNDDGAGDDSGSAYVFTRDGAGAWSQQQKLTAGEGAAADDEFGTSVAFDGNTILIGAPGDDGAEMGGDDRGAAYLFILEDDGEEGTTWTEQQKLTAGDGANDDEFGISVALNGDTAVIGAEKGDGNEIVNTGAAYVFIREDGEGGITWTEQQKLTASDGVEDDRFGESVALDGMTIMIGATLDDDAGDASGSVYVFTNEEGWAETAKLTASDGTSNDSFGASVAVDGDNALIGAPVAPAGNVTDAGAAYVFTRDGGGTWTEEFKLVASNAATDDALGNTGAVAIAGSTVVAGAEMSGDVGAAYVFDLPECVGDADCDGDGIANDIDVNPLAFSDFFDDDPNGGTTAGRVGIGTIMIPLTRPQDGKVQAITVEGLDPPSDGMRAIFSDLQPDEEPVFVRACGRSFFVSTPDQTRVSFVCGSASVSVESGGPASFTFFADDGTVATTILDEGDAVEFENVSGTFKVYSEVAIMIDGTPFILVPRSAATPVTVVIKPTHINRCSKGITTVALLGSASLDVSYLDAASLAFGADSDASTPGVEPIRMKLADVNDDGVLDAVSKLKTSDLKDASLLEDEELPLYVTGKLTDGTLIFGAGDVRLVRSRNCK